MEGTQFWRGVFWVWNRILVEKMSFWYQGGEWIPEAWTDDRESPFAKWWSDIWNGKNKRIRRSCRNRMWREWKTIVKICRLLICKCFVCEKTGFVVPRGYCIFLPGAHYLTITSPYGADSSLNKLLLPQSVCCIHNDPGWLSNHISAKLFESCPIVQSGRSLLRRHGSMG